MVELKRNLSLPTKRLMVFVLSCKPNSYPSGRAASAAKIQMHYADGMLEENSRTEMLMKCWNDSGIDLKPIGLKPLGLDDTINYKLTQNS